MTREPVLGDTVRILTPKSSAYGKLGIVVRRRNIPRPEIKSHLALAEVEIPGRDHNLLVQLTSLEIVHGFDAEFEFGDRVIVRTNARTANAKPCADFREDTLGTVQRGSKDTGAIEVTVWGGRTYWLSTLDIFHHHR